MTTSFKRCFYRPTCLSIALWTNSLFRIELLDRVIPRVGLHQRIVRRHRANEEVTALGRRTERLGAAEVADLNLT